MILTLFKKYKGIWIGPLVVLTIHAIATYLGTYYKYLWFDSPMHFIGGVSIALSVYYYLKLDSQTKTTAITFLAILIGTTAIAAVTWEFIEFSFDFVNQSHHQPGLKDTMKDLFIGLSAAAITALSLIRKQKNL